MINLGGKSGCSVNIDIKCWQPNVSHRRDKALRDHSTGVSQRAAGTNWSDESFDRNVDQQWAIAAIAATSVETGALIDNETGIVFVSGVKRPITYM